MSGGGDKILTKSENSKHFSSLFFFFFGGGSCEPNFFVHISASWVEISLYTEFPLPRLPGSRTVIFRPNPMGWGGLVDPIFFVHVSPCWV